MRPSRKPFNCPACGETVPAGAKSCPECGACERSGWSEDAASDGLDLPEEEFDYEKFVAQEFGGPAKKSPREKFWWIVAVIVLIAFAWLLLGGR